MQAELDALKDRPIDFSDIPPLTREEVTEMRRMVAEGRQKQLFTLRIQSKTILWWKKSLGPGYTGIMSKLLDEATRHPEWIKECL
jgi:hypothetical protein